MPVTTEIVKTNVINLIFLKEKAMLFIEELKTPRFFIEKKMGLK